MFHRVHAFNPSSWEAETDRCLYVRPVWSTEQVPGWPKLCRDLVSKNKTTNIKTKKKKNQRVKGLRTQVVPSVTQQFSRGQT